MVVIDNQEVNLWVEYYHWRVWCSKMSLVETEEIMSTILLREWDPKDNLWKK